MAANPLVNILNDNKNKIKQTKFKIISVLDETELLISFLNYSFIIM